ncbi:5-methylthioadenosine s-adenosylhomocysteine protein [Pleurostoma richardsiae]|uniref:5-methylthioadenosine s-adenosylhomocysteine protein n=1 Tax=Pleurostoma richardsiae TaxID=41990 RepID=A0AA38RJK5_9PEZI|nr:5-methylthioadenosine s-adenosylhomocysteine protein [Pleurostoma richardsiae]
MTLLSLSDQTFTPLSMTSSDLYIGSVVDEDAEEQDRDKEHRPSSPSDGYFRADASCSNNTAGGSNSNNSNTGTSKRWIASRRSLTKPGILKGIGRESRGAAPATVSADSASIGSSMAPQPTRATHAASKEGYGLLLSNSPVPSHRKNIDADDVTSSNSSPSPRAIDPAATPASASLIAADPSSKHTATSGSAYSLPAPEHHAAKSAITDSACAATPSSTQATAAGPKHPASPSGSTAAADANPGQTAVFAPEIIRPKFVRNPSSQHPKPQSSPPSPSAAVNSRDDGLPPKPSDGTASTKVVRSRSVLRHPAPDINTRSGAYTTTIAALEATAERLSSTTSIEDAIRDAHDELKRSDSRRSSILAASVKSPSVNGDAVPADAHLPAALPRSSSILELNTSARFGGYSPAGYIMSPSNSLSGRLRSGSKGSAPISRRSSVKSNRRSVEVEGDAFPFMPRHGPGKGSVHSVHSVHSVRSGPLSLAEIAEIEPPTTLTKEAMDEADRTATAGDDTEDEDTIRASAFQHVEPGATDVEVDMDVTPNADTWAKQPMLDHADDPYWDDHRGPELRLRNPTEPAAYDPDEGGPDPEKRPATSGSGDTYEQTKNAFEDFDGVHCDPDSVAEQFPFRPEESAYAPPPAQRENRQSQLPAARPTSYLDPETGQQMLYYPARVPAMLNLPPKLGRGVRSAMREKRRSEVLSAMPQASRESRVWLPDPLEGHRESALMDDIRGSGSHHTGSEAGGSLAPQSLVDVDLQQDQPVDSAESQQAPPELQHLQRPAKLSEGDKRKSRATMLGDLPPQLRASAFFDLPAEAPRVEMKDGSAMATLDSILDAAAKAPVNAFTDHAFAGHLGAEVYGTDKKARRKSRHSRLLSGDKGHKPRASTASGLAVAEAEKRKSVWSLLPGRKASDSANSPAANEERQRLSALVNGEPSPLSPLSDQEAAALAPDADEEGSSSEDEEEEEEVYQGPPTTLLAELQLRKQQQKMRTRPINKAFPNGMHSTLLELDSVAQVEAKSRRGKRVNLAWEDPAENPDEEESDDEDVPLGVLALKKQLGNADISAIAAEVNRPLGLMERRELEDNEPLSRRRDRIQGKEVPVSMYLNPASAAKRGSTLTLGNLMSGGRGQSSPVIPGTQQDQGAAEDDEIEGETLGERMRRLRAKDEAENPLPRTRPVSNTFSAELLSVFGDDKDKRASGDSKNTQPPAAGGPPPPEEEETLGQRRRRLQAEREAREREMATSSNSSNRAAALSALTGGSGGGTTPAAAQPDRLSRRLSFANVLSATPAGAAVPGMDPREAERLRREEEGARAAREKDAKMAAYRAQMPGQLKEVGTGLARQGGFLGGRFNDGNGGGGAGLRAVSSMSALGAGGGYPQQQMQMQQQQQQQYYQQQLYQQQQYQQQGQMGMMGGSGYVAGAGVGAVGMQQYPQFRQQQQQQPVMGMGMGMNGGYNGGMVGYPGAYGAVPNGAYGAGYAGVPMPMPMQMQMPGQPQGQIDMVERWRQSVMP